MNIKKVLLSTVSSFTLLTSSILTVSCSGKNIDSGFNEKEQMYKYYELDGMKFASKEDAISYVLNEGSERENFKIQKNQVYFGEEKFDSVEKVYERIEKDFNIQTKVVNKNPNEYLISANGEVDPLIVNANERSSEIFKNADGTISSDYDSITARENAINSHYKLIKKNYLAEGQKFSNKDAVLNYYNSKYKNSNDFQISSCYQFSQSCLQEDEIKHKINNSIVSNYEHNGNIISGFDLNNPDKLELTFKEKEAISRVNSRPGLFFVEHNELDEGKVTGQTMIEYTGDFNAFISNEKNWNLIGQSNTGLFDFAVEQIFRSGTLAAINKKNDFIKIGLRVLGNDVTDIDLDNLFKNPVDKFDLKETVMKYSHPGDEISGFNDYVNIQEMIFKYQISGYFDEQVNQLNSLTTLDFDSKEKIALIKLKDLLRETDISKDDSNKLDIVYWNMLYNFNVLDEWHDLIKLIPINKASDFMECLLNPSEKNLTNIWNISFDKNVEKSMEKFISKSNKVLQEVLNNTKEILSVIKDLAELAEYTSAFIECASTVVPVLAAISIAIDILNLIPIQKTLTYELVVPTNRDKITYEVTQNFWHKNEFNPSKIFKTFEIKKNQNIDRFLIHNRYYNSYDSAERYLKELVLEDLKKAKPNFFTTPFAPSKKYDTKDELIDKVFLDFKVNELKLYSDKFGKTFTTQDEAFKSYLNQLNNSKFLEEYYYIAPETSQAFYSDSLDEVQKYIRENVEIENKIVDWTDLYQENYFDKITNLEESKYLVYFVEVKSIKHYFTNLSDLYWFLMIENNYQNRFYYDLQTSFKYHDIYFESQEELLNYVLDKIETIYTNDKNYSEGRI